MSTPTVTPTLPAPPTWSAYETLPDGREHLLAEHLRYTQVLAARFPEAVWAVIWKLDQPTARLQQESPEAHGGSARPERHEPGHRARDEQRQRRPHDPSGASFAGVHDASRVA